MKILLIFRKKDEGGGGEAKKIYNMFLPLCNTVKKMPNSPENTQNKLTLNAKKLYEKFTYLFNDS